MADAAPPADPGNSPSVEPFFLVGAERSGTTLMSLILDHHPQIYCPFESDYLVEHLPDDGSEPDPATIRALLAKDPIARRDGFQIDPGQSYSAAARAFLSSGAAQAGKPFCGAIIHHHIPKLLRIWPEARFLHLQRDPRDVAPSVVGMGWAGNLVHGVQPWLRTQEGMRQLLSEVPEDRWMRLCFEELVRAPEGTMQEVCAFLGTPYDEAMWDYPDHSSYAPPDPRVAERWRGTLKKRQVQWIEAAVGAELQAAGYKASGHPPRGIPAWTRSWLRLQDRLGKIRFRVRRHGIRTVFGYALHNRIGNTATADRLLLKMQERDQELLH